MKASVSDCCNQHAPSPEWMERLRRRAGRVTRPRRVVIAALQQLRRPSTSKEIMDAAAQGGCDLGTVYRSLALFEDMGLVRRVDFGDGVARFEIADSDPAGHHHHHLLCRICGVIVRLDDCILAEMEARLGGRYGFSQISHRLEFFGVCPKCSPAGRRATPGKPSTKRRPVNHRTG